MIITITLLGLFFFNFRGQTDRDSIKDISEISKWKSLLLSLLLVPLNTKLACNVLLFSAQRSQLTSKYVKPVAPPKLGTIGLLKSAVPLC